VTRGDTGAGTVDGGYPAPISNWGWPAGFGSNGIDAALHSGSKCYFFRGDQYIRVTRGDTGAGTVDAGYPKDISTWGWPSGFGREMPNRWWGPARYLFIPLVVRGEPGWDEPPEDHERLVDRRVHADPDPDTGEDRSLASLIASVSYGRARLEATVSAPTILDGLETDDNPTLLAIEAHPDSHLFEY
jgi:hypothetical protein